MNEEERESKKCRLMCEEAGDRLRRVMNEGKIINK